MHHLTINMHDYRPKCVVSQCVSAAQIRAQATELERTQNMSNNNDLDHLLPIASANRIMMNAHTSSSHAAIVFERQI